MTELGAIYNLGLKGSFLVHPESHSDCTSGCASCGAIIGAINEGLLSNNSFEKN